MCNVNFSGRWMVFLISALYFYHSLIMAILLSQTEISLNFINLSSNRKPESQTAE
ncbi:hypothetical protein HOLleu_07314 [Holothuria leucospilota]|uniref:Uncharacterized protein n=1 Tax=Holothuria leucospilota TaxID=206669 RepID=A0A9Q1HGW2_HOLLE|nr:hypothetical protein HOLleu_07314 [Holothuria leucospilota]